MIAKDEAHVIRRCLASVRPIIDHWLVVDTGSRDGTQDVVRAALADLPGRIVERPWIDFAHNRSEALALARPHADYSLVIDADDELVLAPGFAMPPLGADSYSVDIEDGAITYERSQLFKNALPWRYTGVLHEFATCDAAKDAGRLPILMRRNHDGRRRLEPATYRNDAAVLERALATEQDPFLVSRYTFYLAQSYRDCGETEKAVAAYLRRADQGFWAEEVFVALLQAARLAEGLGYKEHEVLALYARATAAVPERAEALHGASRFCRARDRFEDGYWLAKRGAELGKPNNGLFLEPWIYEYGLLDELGVHAYWSHRYAESRDACARLLGSPALPDDMRGRIAQNLRFAELKLPADALCARPIGGTATSANWSPTRPQGGTELMVEALRARMGDELLAIDLQVNLYDAASLDDRPLIVWIHHDIDQGAVRWCRDPVLVARVARFVFISHWQRERFLTEFGLPPDRCVVIRHALEQSSDARCWEAAPVLRCAYTSTPFRGLDVLLDAWDRLPAGKAELHIWSSMRLYTSDDAPYRHLFERARATPGVTYHGLAPNAELRTALRSIHILSYPSTFAETACLSVMEAMAAGCRVVVPAYGALPETTGGYARIYPWSADHETHVRTFAEALADEIERPWRGRSDLAVAQQTHCASVFAWSRCLAEWRDLIQSVRGAATVITSPVDRVPTAPTAAAPASNRLAECLVGLRGKGFRPRGVVDVGAYRGDFSRLARALFPDAPILMLDALPEMEPVLQTVARDLGDAKVVIALVGDATLADAPFFVVDTVARPDLVKTGSSKFRENSSFVMEERRIPQRRLRDILRDLDVSCELLKLDVQGSELDVLRGLDSSLADVEIIVLETSLVDYNKGGPLVAHVIRTLEDVGFVLFDVVEEHRHYDGTLMQIDGVFIRRDSPLRPKGPFWS